MSEPSLSLAAAQALVETKTAPRVTKESIEQKIGSVRYIQEADTGLTICIITMKNGFMVNDISAPASLANFDAEVGKRYAYENAFKKIWPFEAYLLREQLQAEEDRSRGQDDAVKVEPAQAVPSSTLALFRSHKLVRAGQIYEVTPAGCFVLNEDGNTGALRLFQPGMTTRYQPKVGDFWIVYDDGYEAISQREPFLEGYALVEGKG